MSLPISPSAPATLFPYTTLFRSRQQRLVAVLGEQLARSAVELVAGRAGPHASDRLVERLLHEPVVLDELCGRLADAVRPRDRQSTRLNSSHLVSSYAVFCLKKKK